MAVDTRPLTVQVSRLLDLNQSIKTSQLGELRRAAHILFSIAHAIETRPNGESTSKALDSAVQEELGMYPQLIGVLACDRIINLVKNLIGDALARTQTDESDTKLNREFPRNPGKVSPYLIAIAGRLPVNLMGTEYEVATRVERALKVHRGSIFIRPSREDVSEGPGPESILYEALLSLAKRTDEKSKQMQRAVANILALGKIQVGRNIWADSMTNQEVFGQGVETPLRAEYRKHVTINGEKCMLRVSVASDPEAAKKLLAMYQAITTDSA